MIARSMRFGGIVDIGRGSHSVGRIYGDLADPVCEDIAGYRREHTLCVMCSMYVDSSSCVHSTLLYSTLLDLMIIQDYCV